MDGDVGPHFCRQTLIVALLMTNSGRVSRMRCCWPSRERIHHEHALPDSKLPGRDPNHPGSRGHGVHERACPIPPSGLRRQQFSAARRACPRMSAGLSLMVRFAYRRMNHPADCRMTRLGYPWGDHPIDLPELIQLFKVINQRQHGLGVYCLQGV